MSVPAKLGKYEIQGPLGKGAMGVVYRGYDPILDREVAIKVVDKGLLDLEEAPEILARFKREAQAAAGLNHPGIVSIHDYGESEEFVFIAMEYIKGTELKKFFDRQERFDMPRILRIMGEILDALDHAHRNGVVHRDVKPANIMITDEGRVKVADFGVAYIESSSLTKTGAHIGTPAYMSPEQHLGAPVDARSDVFSAGVILYQFLTGERPFKGGIYTIIHQILKQEPLAPSEINFSIPRELDTVVSKALAKRPAERFGSAREFAEAMVSPAATEKSSSAARPAEAELDLWKAAGESADPRDLDTFLLAYPGSRFAVHARARLERLRAEEPEKTLITPALKTEVQPVAGAPDSQDRARRSTQAEPETRPTDVPLGRTQSDGTRESPSTVEPERKKRTGVRVALVALGVLVAVGLAVIIHQGLHLTWGFEEQDAIMAQIERIDAKEREIEAKLAAAKKAGEARSEFAVWTEIHDLSTRHVFRSDVLRRVRQYVAPSFLLARVTGNMREALRDLQQARSSAERVNTLFEPIEQAAQARGRLSEVATELKRVGEEERHDVSRGVKTANEAMAKSEALLNEANFAEALEVSRQAEGDAVRSLNTLIDDFVAKYSEVSARGLAAGQIEVAGIALERAKALSARKGRIQ